MKPRYLLLLLLTGAALAVPLGCEYWDEEDDEISNVDVVGSWVGEEEDSLDKTKRNDMEIVFQADGNCALYEVVPDIRPGLWSGPYTVEGATASFEYTTGSDMRYIYYGTVTGSNYTGTVTFRQASTDTFVNSVQFWLTRQ